MSAGARIVALALALATADAPGDQPATAGACGTTAVAITTIQGADSRSPFLGQRLTVEAVVTADFQRRGEGLRGFFLQGAADSDPRTSEGLFVYTGHEPIAVTAGERLRLTGEVHEYGRTGATLTELRGITAVTRCGEGKTLGARSIDLPLQDAERVEGMLVAVEPELHVVRNDRLGRYGQLTLSADADSYQPTQIAPPTPDSDRTAATQGWLILDDGSARRDPRPVPYLDRRIDGGISIRAGDRLTAVRGVLDQRWGRYRLQPLSEPSIETANPRPSAPPAVGGTLKLAVVNLDNYFNGDGRGDGFPTARGARNGTELQRQRVKLVAALTALDADLLALAELENDGYGSNSAIAGLTAALNRDAGTEDYGYVDPGLRRLGGDAIAVGLIYRQQTLKPVGRAATTATGAFARGNRQPLAQTFETGAGFRFTAAAVHFKSKGGCPDDGPDNAQGDGQGCWNATRTAAAEQLLDWLNGRPTEVEAPAMVLGDLNAYAMEDPIRILTDAGFVDLVVAHRGKRAYAYRYRGRAGALQHALADAALAERITGAAPWHINADEPVLLDYGHSGDRYHRPDPFRSSDHDPLLIGLDPPP